MATEVMPPESKLDEKEELSADEKFLQRLSKLVGDGREEDTLEFLAKDYNQATLIKNAWDAIPIVATHLSKDKHPIIVTCCEHALKKIAELAEPKEVLIVLLEHADALGKKKHDDVRFKALLLPMQICLLRLPDKSRGRSVSIALETINSHVLTLTLPKDHSLHGKERVVLHTDKEVQRICFVLEAVLDFMTPLVNQVSFRQENGLDRQEACKLEVEALSLYGIKLCSFPLGYLDLEPPVQESDENSGKENKAVESRTRALAEQLMQLMVKLSGNFVKMLTTISAGNDEIVAKRQKKDKEKKDVEENENEENSSDDFEDLVSVLGMSIFSYLAFSEGLGMDSVPQMYSHEYLFEFNSGFSDYLLRMKESLVFTKGLKLLMYLACNLKDSSLPAELLDFAMASNLMDNLTRIAIFDSKLEFRQQALKLFPVMLKKFDMKGRYHFILYLMKKSKHSGMIGYAIQLLKDEIDHTLADEKPSECFTGASLEKMMQFVCSLPNGATSDLLSCPEHIMGALNLVRYLVLKDLPTVNRTGIWNYIPVIEEKYLETLRLAINMSRSHYQLELKTVKAEKSKRKAIGNNKAELNIEVGGKNMPELSKEQQLHALNQAIDTFDMMESIVGRVSEIIETQRKVAPKGGHVMEVEKDK